MGDQITIVSQSRWSEISTLLERNKGSMVFSQAHRCEFPKRLAASITIQPEGSDITHKLEYHMTGEGEGFCSQSKKILEKDIDNQTIPLELRTVMSESLARLAPALIPQREVNIEMNIEIDNLPLFLALMSLHETQQTQDNGTSDDKSPVVDPPSDDNLPREFTSPSEDSEGFTSPSEDSEEFTSADEFLRGLEHVG